MAIDDLMEQTIEWSIASIGLVVFLIILSAPPILTGLSICEELGATPILSEVGLATIMNGFVGLVPWLFIIIVFAAMLSMGPRNI